MRCKHQWKKIKEYTKPVFGTSWNGKEKKDVMYEEPAFVIECLICHEIKKI